tara:strand:+ start:315 stop:572 length:258 start_codon:yes stop_codon:yes gene_type:complete
MPNPFKKTVDKEQPYAIYTNGDFFWNVLSTSHMPASERKNSYARWFCFVTSSMCPDGEYGDTYAADVQQYGRLVQCTPEWQDHYG